ncbi:Cof-type HAD-IIB family hydrolase [Paenibacillus marinisediminis]
MSIQIVAIDMDGTLLHDDHTLSKRNADTIRQVAEAGVEIVLCTGRSPSSTLPYLDELGLEGIVITHNGAATVASKSRKELNLFELQGQDLDRYMDYCRKHQIHFDVNTAFDLYVDSLEVLTSEVLHIYSQFLIKPKLFPGWDQLQEPALKLTMSGEKDKIDEIEAEMNLWDHKLHFIRSGDYFIDVMHPEATKGNALMNLAEQQQVPRENILAIGNYYNDVTMIQYAGIGVAMDNSPLDVKAAADDVTLSNNEDGVHAALQKYILSKK